VRVICARRSATTGDAVKLTITVTSLSNPDSQLASVTLVLTQPEITDPHGTSTPDSRINCSNPMISQHSVNYFNRCENRDAAEGTSAT
jgi:hypothetical protein